MQYSDSSIFEDAINLIRDSKGFPAFNMRFKLVTPEKTITVAKVLARHITRDFVKNHYDEITLDFTLGMGTWIHEVYPHRKNLKGVLELTPTKLHNVGGDETGEPIERTYLVKLNTTTDPTIEKGNEVTANKEVGDRTKQSPITVTLMSEACAVTRNAQTYGWFLKSTMGDIAKGSLMTVGVKGIPTKNDYLTGNFEGVVGVEIVEPDNKKVYNTCYVPMGTKLANIATHLQLDHGIYYNGVGTYLHKGVWFIYPITDFSRYNNSSKRVSIYRIPKEKMFGVESTFAFKGDELTIVSNDDGHVSDFSEIYQGNEGNVMKLISAETMVDDFFQVRSDKALVASKDDVMINGAAEERDDGIYNARPEVRISSNVYRAQSLLNQGLTQEYIVPWNNADASLIEPGMPCRFYFLKGTETIGIDGIIAGIDSTTAYTSAGTGRDPAVTTCKLRIVGERS